MFHWLILTLVIIRWWVVSLNSLSASSVSTWSERPIYHTITAGCSYDILILPCATASSPEGLGLRSFPSHILSLLQLCSFHNWISVELNWNPLPTNQRKLMVLFTCQKLLLTFQFYYIFSFFYSVTENIYVWIKKQIMRVKSTHQGMSFFFFPITILFQIGQCN